ncbi:hypothetical protein [Magnetococcus sp. PR-3]|uniref:hypothetical protein n=1 Tax=Magnetococcus sp. PR-3 TaxID=3120355 RepID=UPI002FCDFD6A
MLSLDPNWVMVLFAVVIQLVVVVAAGYAIRTDVQWMKRNIEDLWEKHDEQQKRCLDCARQNS